jgi:charged multivesicular body protein 5
MKRVFGQKKAPGPPPPSLAEASSSIGKRVDDLDFKISKLDEELLGYKKKLHTAKGPTKATYQKRAMDVLKRKKMYEQQRDQIANQQFNVESAAFGMESIKDTINTVAAMKGANVEFKKQMKHLNVNDVEDMQDDLADLMEDMNEVNEIMGRSYAMPNDIDEADLEAELDMLGDDLEVESAEPSYLDSTPSLPAQPTGYPISGRTSLANSSGAGRVDEYGLPLVG